MENGIKISQLPLDSQLLDGREFLVRSGSTNRRVLGRALQARIWWPEITHLRIADKGSTTQHYALEEVPTLHVSLASVTRTISRNRRIPLILCAPWDPAAEGMGQEFELQGWRLNVGNVPETNLGLGLVLPADRTGGENATHWLRIF
jgi:hypothetical protein